MTDEFILTVSHKGAQKDFKARLVLQGYTHKFLVLIGEIEVYFEPDEEGQHRAVRMPWQEE